MEIRDLDNNDAWLVQSMADKGETVEDVAKAFWITESQVWKFLNSKGRSMLRDKFIENKEKKEGKWVPPKDPLAWKGTPSTDDQDEHKKESDPDEEPPSQ